MEAADIREVICSRLQSIFIRTLRARLIINPVFSNELKSACEACSSLVAENTLCTSTSLTVPLPEAPLPGGTS